VGGSSAKRRLSAFEFLAETKVRDKEAWSAVFAHVDEYVLRLKIAMNDAQGVQVAQSIGDLVQDAWHITLTSLCQLPELARLRNNISK
jgi:hypothetical protein